MEYAISIDSIRKAREHIRSYANYTPVMTCSTYDGMVNTKARFYFKCECFQKVGAFKFRGACNAVQSLSEDQARHGVVTHSSGNHAQALALAAKMRGIKATIVMPNDAPEIKKRAVRGYGAEIIEVEPGAWLNECERLVKETGSTFVHPSDDPLVMSGQGTLMLELYEQMDGVAPLDAIIVPIGGGGLISGIAVAAKALYPNIKVYAAEPAQADDAFRSKQAGNRVGHVDNKVPDTIADGLRTTLGPNTWPIVRDLVDQVITVSESEIKHGFRIVYERMKLVIEPSAAVGVAVGLSSTFQREMEKHHLENIAIVLCGGNMQLDSLFESM